jgi:hypothetical protein
LSSVVILSHGNALTVACRSNVSNVGATWAGRAYFSQTLSGNTFSFSASTLKSVEN